MGAKLVLLKIFGLFMNLLINNALSLVSIHSKAMLSQRQRTERMHQRCFWTIPMQPVWITKLIWINSSKCMRVVIYWVINRDCIVWSQGMFVKRCPNSFEDHPESLVALAYFDMGPYLPTKVALESLVPHLMPGSVLLMDELTWSESLWRSQSLQRSLCQHSIQD